MAAIDLVVTDLDGTLWDAQPSLHPRTRRALDELAERGTPLLVATGRRVHSARSALAGVGLQPPAVMLNGAIGLDLATGDRFHRQVFAREEASVILQAFLAHNLRPCVYVEHEDVSVLVDPSPSTHPDHLASFTDESRTVELCEAIESLPIQHFAVIGIDRQPAQAVHEALRDAGSTHLYDDRQFGGSSLTVGPSGLSKWSGVAAYCDMAGLDAGRVLAIGDGPNDVELLRGAAIAVVPADGHPDAIAQADHVVPPARDGGWSELLELL
ncbi:MAG: HAD family hydrolase [Myxococcales bacterium]|nr:HAD family hydrolase [Myxococcales bacterium]MDD9964684.1 HAD family hydrolase [Myxococcales bacterium]